MLIRNILLQAPLMMFSILGGGAVPTTPTIGQGAIQGKASPDVTSKKADADAAYPSTEGVLILDGVKRIYLTGSPLCKSVGCALPPLNDVTGYIIKDLASASTVEGRVDGIQFALNEAQIGAIK
jgi:hypothetical protein